MANGKRASVTNDKIYELVNSTRLELKGDITDLRKQFDMLESGRLTALERRMNDFVVAQANKDAIADRNTATLSAKFVIIYSIVGAIFVALVTAIAYKIIVGSPTGGH